MIEQESSAMSSFTAMVIGMLQCGVGTAIFVQGLVWLLRGVGLIK
jgi:hypothetical protein